MEMNAQEVVVTKGITISLNEEEAAMLFAVCGNIMGWNPENNVRDLTDELWENLNQIFPDFHDSNGYGQIVQKYVDNIDQRLRIREFS
jgi:hypothetical protein